MQEVHAIRTDGQVMIPVLLIDSIELVDANDFAVNTVVLHLIQIRYQV